MDGELLLLIILILIAFGVKATGRRSGVIIKEYPEGRKRGSPPRPTPSPAPQKQNKRN